MHRYYKKAKQKNPTTYISAHTPTAKEILDFCRRKLTKVDKSFRLFIKGTQDVSGLMIELMDQKAWSRDKEK